MPTYVGKCVFHQIMLYTRNDSKCTNQHSIGSPPLLCVLYSRMRQLVQLLGIAEHLISSYELMFGSFFSSRMVQKGLSWQITPDNFRTGSLFL
jgi:hypothetical protein